MPAEFNLRASVCTLAVFSLLAGCSRTPEQREADHLKKGRQYLAEKSYKKAVIEFKIASQNMPKHAEPVYQLGMTYLTAGATRLAVESFQKAIALDPNFQPARYQLALFKAGTRKPELLEEAQKEISTWSAAHPNDGEALATLGLIAAKLNNRPEAIRLLEAGLAKDPSLFRIADSVVAVYAGQKDAESAKAVARDLADKLPSSPEAATLRAQVSLATNDLPDADAQIARALTLKRGFEPALQLRLRRELLSHDQDQAEETTRELSQLPEQRMWGAYARILFTENKIDQGIAEYERALKEHNNDPQLRDDYAVSLLSANRKKESEAVVNATLAKSPKDTRALLLRATLEVDRSDVESAARDVKALLDLKVFSAQLSYQEARIFAIRGDRVREGDLLTEAVKTEPRMLVARLRLAGVLIESGKPNNAIAILDQAPEAQKHTVPFVFERNRALMASSQWDEAGKSVKNALAQARTPGFLFQDAVLRLRARDVPGARKDLDESFALAPNDPSIINLLGEVMRQQGDFPGFVAELKDAAAKNPNSAILQHAMGSALERQGQTDGARAAFEAAAKDGDIVSSQIEIATIDVRAGRADQARQRLQTLIKDHDNARARLLLAELEIGRDSVDAALADYLAAIKLEPNNALAMNNMAACLATRRKKFEDALFWGQKALALAPGNPAVEDTLGWTYYLAGKYDLALPWLEKSERTLDRPVAHYHMAANLLKAGDRTRATQEYQQALKADPKSPERTQLDPLFR